MRLAEFGAEGTFGAEGAGRLDVVVAVGGAEFGDLDYSFLDLLGEEIVAIGDVEFLGLVGFDVDLSSFSFDFFLEAIDFIVEFF